MPLTNDDDKLLQVEHLRQYFNKGNFHAVDDISFHIKRGEVLGLVGESGCGKTTTGRTIIKLYTPTGGTVRFNGKVKNQGIWEYSSAIKKSRDKFSLFRRQHMADKHALAQARAERHAVISEQKKLIVQAKKLCRNSKFETKIQMIFQDPVSSLDPRMTVREIIAEGLRIQGERDQASINHKVNEVLVKVGLLPEYADRYPHEFSGGQRQRIGIARAIIMKPELIIADEPVSALDVSIKAQVINLLNGLKKDMGLTILFIAHDLSVVKYFSDRIAVMYYGKIVETATSTELFTHPLHPYTKALLSAIPLPDPTYEKKRRRIVYNPETAHDYSVQKPEMREVYPGHFVYCSEKEFDSYKQTYKNEPGVTNEA